MNYTSTQKIEKETVNYIPFLFFLDEIYRKIMIRRDGKLLTFIEVLSFIKNHKRFQLFFKAIIPSLFVLSFLFKVIYFEVIFGNLTKTNGDFFLLIVKHDSFIIGLLLLLFYISSITPKILKIILRFSIVVLIVLYIVDIFIFLNFNTHLLLEDIFRYSSDITIFFSFKSFLTVKIILFVVVVVPIGAIILLSFLTNSDNYKNRSYFLLFSFVLLSFSLLGRDRYQNYNWVYQNMFELNYNQGMNLDYSDKMKKEYSNKNYALIDNATCTDKKENKKNIILLVIESYSMYHSEYFSGMNNYTPYMDKLAKENISFKNFHANSFKTEGGLIALLMGLNPIPVVNQYYTKGKGFKSTLHFKDSSLPSKLNRLGYQTEFLTTGDLGFSNKDYWLDQIGFDYKEGSENPYYNNWKRYRFNSAEDKALFNRVKSRIELQEKPYFITIENVSTHYPFINPEDDIKSEKGAFGYTDKQVYSFYQYLKENNFFDNGILIVVADHRATTQITEKELELYSEKAPARIPMFIIDGKTNSVVNKRFQQIDIPNSIINLVSNESCTSDFQGDIFQKKEPKYILHSRYDNKNIVSLFTESRDYRIKLDGDNTSFIKDSPRESKRVLDKINYERVVRE